MPWSLESTSLGPQTPLEVPPRPPEARPTTHQWWWVWGSFFTAVRQKGHSRRCHYSPRKPGGFTLPHRSDISRTAQAFTIPRHSMFKIKTPPRVSVLYECWDRLARPPAPKSPRQHPFLMKQPRTVSSTTFMGLDFYTHLCNSVCMCVGVCCHFLLASPLVHSLFADKLLCFLIANRGLASSSLLVSRSLSLI